MDENQLLEPTPTQSVFLNLDKIKLLEEDDDIMLVDLWLLHEGRNRNKCDLKKEVIEEAIPSFYNKFIVYKFDNSYYPTDVVEHNKSLNDTSMNIAGIILKDTGYKWVKKNGKNYLVMCGAISKVYQPILANIIKKRGGNMKISIEILLPEDDVKNKDEDGYIVPSFIRLRGVALLGQNIQEGIEGSHLDVTKFALVTNSFLNNDNVQIIENKYNPLLKGTVMSHIEDNSKKFIKDDSSEGKEEGTMQTVNNSLSARTIEEKIWVFLKDYKYSDGDWEGRKYYIEDIYPDEHFAIIRDNETGKIYKLPYELDVDGEEVSIERDKMSALKEVVKKEHYVEKDHEDHVIHNVYNLLCNAEDFGTGSEIKIDESEEAVSDTPWGEVDKTDLRNKVLEASNYKELVHKVYALVEEGWEEAPSEKLKYPIMEIKGGKAVYNKGGLASALGYAKKENEEEVISKVEKIREDLDLDEDSEDKKAVKENSLELDDLGTPDEFATRMAELQEALAKSEEECASLRASLDDKCKEFEEVKAKCDVFEREKEVISMREFLDKYSQCFDEETIEELNKKTEEMSYCDFEKLVKDKVCEYVAKSQDGKKQGKVQEDEDDLTAGQEDKAKKAIQSGYGFEPLPFSYTLPQSNNGNDTITKESLYERYAHIFDK